MLLLCDSSQYFMYQISLVMIYVAHREYSRGCCSVRVIAEGAIARNILRHETEAVEIITYCRMIFNAVL